MSHDEIPDPDEYFNPDYNGLSDRELFTILASVFGSFVLGEIILVLYFISLGGLE